MPLRLHSVATTTLLLLTVCCMLLASTTVAQSAEPFLIGCSNEGNFVYLNGTQTTGYDIYGQVRPNASLPTGGYVHGCVLQHAVVFVDKVLVPSNDDLWFVKLHGGNATAERKFPGHYVPVDSQYAFVYQDAFLPYLSRVDMNNMVRTNSTRVSTPVLSATYDSSTEHLYYVTRSSPSSPSMLYRVAVGSWDATSHTFLGNVAELELGPSDIWGNAIVSMSVAPSGKGVVLVHDRNGGELFTSDDVFAAFRLGQAVDANTVAALKEGGPQGQLNQLYFMRYSFPFDAVNNFGATLATQTLPTALTDLRFVSVDPTLVVSGLDLTGKFPMETFETQSLQPWILTARGLRSMQCSAYSGNYAWVMTSNVRELRMVLLTPGTHTLRFYYRAGSSSQCEQPDFNEDLIVQFVYASGSVLTQRNLASTSATRSQWTLFTLQVTVSGQSGYFVIKQTSFSGDTIDNWGIDNLKMDSTANAVATTTTVYPMETFETATTQSWLVASSGTRSSTCGSESPPYAFKFTGSTRYLQTMSLASGRHTLSFFYNVGKDGSSGCERPDSGEDLVVRYRQTIPTSQEQVETISYSTASTTAFRQYSFTVNAPNTGYLEITQARFSSSTIDNWLIDNVQLTTSTYQGGSLTTPTPTPTPGPTSTSTTLTSMRTSLYAKRSSWVRTGKLVLMFRPSLGSVSVPSKATGFKGSNSNDQAILLEKGSWKISWNLPNANVIEYTVVVSDKKIAPSGRYYMYRTSSSSTSTSVSCTRWTSSTSDSSSSKTRKMHQVTSKGLSASKATDYISTVRATASARSSCYYYTKFEATAKSSATTTQDADLHVLEVYLSGTWKIGVHLGHVMAMAAAVFVVGGWIV